MEGPPKPRPKRWPKQRLILRSFFGFEKKVVFYQTIDMKVKQNYRKANFENDFYSRGLVRGSALVHLYYVY